MRSNSLLGAYAYPSPTSARPHAPTNVDGDVFSYDANGNMLIGLNGKVMTYDGENRPLSVTNSAGTTTYEYGPDGERLKNINPDGTITLYLQRSEIRDFGDAANESVLVYPFGNYREVAGALSVLHRDHLNSVRAISDASGERFKRPVGFSFGEAREIQNSGLLTRHQRLPPPFRQHPDFTVLYHNR